MRESSWPSAQRNRLLRFLETQARDPATCWVGYWNSDAWGRSANGGSEIEPAAPRVTHEVAGPLTPCSKRALHATREPHRWKGVRVWVVALLGERQDCGDGKSAALKRVVIGEVLPSDVIDPWIAVRMNLSRAYLSGAYLSRANLSGADLSRANLSGAYLGGADLSRADLSRADLSRADLSGAYLSRANLSGAYLGGAYLSRADLSGAYLSGADLSRADLSRANLSGAYLGRTNLSRADLDGAYLSGADLSGAYLGGSDRPAWLPEQWVVPAQGYVWRHV